ncbi:DUF6233 domain-containing protein [Streptomyces sp. NPDC005303]|uniref:DUF6233 domain-containing protein n=1 Tax=Streptomyces sp. NPDC005303 TaxID=3155713 RepID=UPI0033AFF968
MGCAKLLARKGASFADDLDAPEERRGVRACRRLLERGSAVEGCRAGPAVRALAEGVTACPQCRPDTVLGILD